MHVLKIYGKDYRQSTGSGGNDLLSLANRLERSLNKVVETVLLARNRTIGNHEAIHVDGVIALLA